MINAYVKDHHVKQSEIMEWENNNHNIGPWSARHFAPIFLSKNFCFFWNVVYNFFLRAIIFPFFPRNVDFFFFFPLLTGQKGEILKNWEFWISWAIGRANMRASDMRDLPFVGEYKLYV